ncbi:RNA 2',3'-cyclic phosphodiesterase [Brachybacterium vulturis]|uniref:RNA 2',3'-cyclic phosphodiesterase n=1 Tax=Brachybacterium vulturis TaxID=2017484 RepID=A0A291GNR7_9MICO|nr:RNA 2',3'-cyclic phosphodiesterase [Brachybacterium vulturis]ATG51875.1 RNA 2',3'-cyclic phosphodiesterase [Brachybacterium vulturis]
MRVFVALRPAPAALEHLDSALEEVRAGAGRALRWGDPAQWHLTLAFRPDLPGGALADAVDHLAILAAHHRPLRLELSGAGVFSARALWIGVAGDTEALAALMGESLLEGEGRERRRAHLTVARVSARAPRAPRRRRRGEAPPPDPTQLLLADAVRALSVYRGPTWEASELELVESVLGQGRSGGPRHEVLATVPLG